MPPDAPYSKMYAIACAACSSVSAVAVASASSSFNRLLQKSPVVVAYKERCIGFVGCGWTPSWSERRMRGKPDDQAQIYYPIDIESWIAEDHPPRAVKRRADEVLASMRKDFDRACSKMGRPQRKMEVVLRLRRGEDLVEVSQETQIAPHELEEWRRVFIERGQQGLKSRSRDPGERELIRTRAKLGKMTMRMELAEELLEKKGIRGRGEEARKVTKHRGAFPTPDSARKVLYWQS